ncbi:MAG: acyl-CoA/acyl-ACP dehydrogenase [Chromatiales bacterium]|jgi:alkylation response protein AidB-like acyl-CoA dehydrogenase|nr:acyl-CoA/acyl-ACP dehydrogenase [Chromatiales bacterium]
MTPTPKQVALMTQAYDLAMGTFAPRAAQIDRDAVFPFEDYADLHSSGLLGLCVPEEYGGLGGDFETYCLVSEQLAKGNASTALTYNMHCLTMMMMGEMADRYPMTDAQRERHGALRAAKFREVTEQGVFYGQPHSEPVEQGETDTQYRVGGRRFGTRAEKVEGGYRVNGRKFFVSLSGAADYFATPALLMGDAPWNERTLYLQVPRDASGVQFSGEWDPLGMRGTVSRDLLLEDVFVADDGDILPPGVFGDLYLSSPHGPIAFSATFLGLMQQAFDYAVGYLRGEVEGSPAKGEVPPATAYAVAQMHFKIEAARALYYRSASEAPLPVTPAITQRARAAHVTIQRTVVEVTQEAMRVCGGRGTLRRLPLERYARDARASAVMRPWTQDIATENTWKELLALEDPLLR